MNLKKLGHGKNEEYACSVKDAKNIFYDTDPLFVSFGLLGKSFSFDSSFTDHPVIDGMIICSVSVNKRLNQQRESPPYLCFYLIRDKKYNDEYREKFCEIVLPEMKDWLEDKTEASGGLPGVYQLLVEWTGSGFRLYDCRFK